MSCSPRYLALVSALASGADWLFIPEAPPEDGWENFMCERLGEVSVGGGGVLLEVPATNRWDAERWVSPWSVALGRGSRGGRSGHGPGQAWAQLLGQC